ncbi:ankyrin repeat domain-containing protein [Aspergillus lucknowensis]|uniref:Hspc200 n=1 Tax=Aspergillus lucknowensis TaxID=176173 RepID=A0ABR4LZW5_9EURO
MSTIAPPPSTAPPVTRLPSPPRQTPQPILDEMQAACSARDFPRFKMTFDRWTSYGFDIHELSNIMMQAVQDNFPEIISTLLSHGQPIYNSYAIQAVRSKATGVLNTFMEHGWDVNQPMGELSPTVLAYAVHDEELTTWLLDHGADPNKQCSIDLTPLSWAVEEASFNTIKLLFNRGADVHKGEPLHHAINRKSEIVEVLALLLERGALVNGKQYENHYNSWRLFFFMGLGTALHQAAWLGKVDAVRYLLEQGADTSIKDATDRTPLDWAVNSNHPEIVAILESAIQERGA